MHFQPQDAYIIVDFQNDFCSGGSLAIPDAEVALPLINQLTIQAYNAGTFIVASRDWHPINHISFQQRGGLWPVHCVQESVGAKFHPDLFLPSSVTIISKGMNPEEEQYSAFDKTDLLNLMREHHICRVFIVGLALDYCVKATAIDAIKLGLEAHVIMEGTKPVMRSNVAEITTEMRDLGVKIN